MISGEAFIEENNIYYDLKQGDVLLIEPQKEHGGFKVSKNGCCFYWMHFHLSGNNIINFKHFNINDTIQEDNITFFFSQLLSVSNLPIYPSVTAHAMSILIINYLNVANATLLDKKDRLINEIMEYIRINVLDDITVATISKYFCYNCDYISLLFKKKTGIGLKEVISKSKINYAKTLLISSQYSIKEISSILNFNSTQHFIGFFKYHENISPLKYKNRNIAMHYNKE